MRPTDIVSTTHGKLVHTQANDRAMRRRNPSVDLGPGLDGSEELPYSHLNPGLEAVISGFGAELTSRYCFPW